MKKFVVAAASSYNQKFFYNSEFDDIPTDVRYKLRIITIQLAEKLHGIFTVGFYEDGDLYFEISGEECDYDFDELGGKLEIERLQREEADFVKSLRLWYFVFRTEEGKKMTKIAKMQQDKKVKKD